MLKLNISNMTSSATATTISSQQQNTTAAKLIVIQKVVNNGVGKKNASDFNIMVTGNSSLLPTSFPGSFHRKNHNIAFRRL